MLIVFLICEDELFINSTALVVSKSKENFFILVSNLLASFIAWLTKITHSLSFKTVFNISSPVGPGRTICTEV